MIRRIDWRDLLLLHRVRGRALCLDTELACTRGPSALQLALLAGLSPGQRACTLIAGSAVTAEKPLVGQFCLRANEHTARMAFIGPAAALKVPRSVKLLEALAKSAGERGAHQLVAEIAEISPVFESLRNAGFSVFGRQTLWQLNAQLRTQVDAPEAYWRMARPTDRPAILGLHQGLVPARLRQIEPSAAGNGQRLVHWQKDELLGYLRVVVGPRGACVHPFIHPEIEKVDALIAAFAAQHQEISRKPLYVGVHSFQDWMNAVLERVGFDHVADQVLMVKHLAVAVRRPTLASLPSLERTSPEPTAPFVRSWTQDAPRRASRRS